MCVMDTKKSGLNILQVIPNFSPRMGGVVNAVSTLSNKLVENGHEVTILTTDYYQDEIPQHNPSPFNRKSHE